MPRDRSRPARRLAARAAPVALAGAIVLGTAALLAVGDGSPRTTGDRDAPRPAATPGRAVRNDAPAVGGDAAHAPPRAPFDPGDGSRAPADAARPEPRTAAERIAELREALRRAPSDGEVRRALGVELVESGEVDEGARLLVEAARLLGHDALEEHGVPMLRLLHANAREEEEAQVRERIEQLGL